MVPQEVRDKLTVNWSSTREVQDSHISKKTCLRPHHMRKRAVYESRPKLQHDQQPFFFSRGSTYKYERDNGYDPSSLKSTTYSDGANSCQEYELEFTEQDCRNRAYWIGQYSSMKCVLEVPNDPITFPVGD